ncbi:MAG TPA: VCBS repeat-containing protein [Streptomyces sp.]|nr:VCBS repeat-containing protein [Streptomyces sp.]
MVRVRRNGIRAASALGTLVLLAACGPGPEGGSGAGPAPARTAQAPAQRPVPRGGGSDIADDFNGDGHRDLVLNDLAKTQSHADDAGIGVVYGGPRGLVPGTRRLLSPARHAARTQGQPPAVFDAEASCDLDGDGFTDLVVSTDPPYDGQGRPPVPLQILFGSPAGLTGKAVKVAVPERARSGNDWPDQPVCGDFDGDGAQDLVVHASGGMLTYLRGPFDHRGAPRAAGAPLPAPGPLPTGPAADVDRDGYDDLVVREGEGRAASAIVLGGPNGPARTGVTLPAGLDVALGDFGGGKALDAAVGSMDGTALRYDLPAPTRGTPDTPGSALDAGDLDGDGRDDLVSSGSRLRVFPGGASGPAAATGQDAAPVTVDPPAAGTTRVLAVGDFDGDGRSDLVVRSYRSETRDTVAVYPGSRKGLVAREPAVRFSTTALLAR